MAQSFKGLTANGDVEPGLFPLSKTGMTPVPAANAVTAFIDSLNVWQRQAAIFDTARSGSVRLYFYEGVYAEVELDRDRWHEFAIRRPCIGLSEQCRDPLCRCYLNSDDAAQRESAKVLYDEVARHFDATYFSWISESSEQAPIYDRAHSPVIFIEFTINRA